MFFDFLSVCWEILRESSLWMFFGFFMAGVLKAFVPADLVSRHLGANQTGNVVKAAILGVPLPLCSCAVIPAAAGLRSQGASKGATASFMISTPETGVDSIAMSWALLDPLMTLLRPLAAFGTALVAGLAVNAWDSDKKRVIVQPFGGCGCGDCGCGATRKPVQGWWPRFLAGQRFAFGDLFADIGVWFAGGVLLAACITLFLPDDLGTFLPNFGFLSMLGMLAIALPMYVCATASTPIAAALAMKGVPPGALLVFLLAGPATNAATITMVAKLLGRRSAVIYVGAIVCCTLLFGAVVDHLYGVFGYDVQHWLSGNTEHADSFVTSITAGIMTVLLGRELLKALWHRIGKSSVQNSPSVR